MAVDIAQMAKDLGMTPEQLKANIVTQMFMKKPKPSESEQSELLQKRLSFLARAISLDESISIKLEERGDACFCEYDDKGRQLSITIPKVSDNIEILEGLLCHEIGHWLYSKILDEIDEEKDDKRKHYIQDALNSLEDYRVETAVSEWYPDSDYLLWVSGRFIRRRALESSASTILHNPISVLHFLLDGIDLTRFLDDKGCRKAIRSLAEELKTSDFKNASSTADILPSAKHVVDVLWDYLPSPNDSNPPPTTSKTKQKNPPRENKNEQNPCKNNASGDSKDTEDKQKNDTDEETTTPMSPEELPDNRPESEKMLIEKIPYTEPKEYARPYEPEVYTLTDFTGEDITHCFPIFLPETMQAEGREVGRSIMRKLKFKKKNRRFLLDGDLDMDTIVDEMIGSGSLKTDKVFRDEKKLLHDHSVMILIDLSGSMGTQVADGIDRLTMAKSSAMMISSALEEMHVPYAIHGFSATENQLQIVDYQIKSFDEAVLDYMRLEKVNFIEKSCVNRDSDSIRHATKILSRQRGKKILFIISDGQPNHKDGVEDYRAFNGQKNADTHCALKEAEAVGIHTIGIAISGDAETFIRAVYPRGFYVDDIRKLPQMLVDIYLETTRDCR